MSRAADIAALGKFARHTPRILRRQLMFQLIEHYLNDDEIPKNSPESFSSSDCKPSMQRFHGALLFVDISGFTALSLRLNVEELKNHINNYFTKMLDIVEKHGGDVIKFAGDALFIAWQVDLKPNPEQLALIRRQSSRLAGAGHESDFTRASRQAVEKAVACGIEITTSCSNFRIELVSSSPTNGKNSSADSRTSPSHAASRRDSVSMFRRLLPSMFNSNITSPANIAANNDISHTQSAPNLPSPTSPKSATGTGVKAEPDSDSVAYLNVHAGVSMGLMAGIDIGSNERYEYFLVGEPLTKVAYAESQAALGELVLCPETHSLLHPLKTSQRIATEHSTVKKTRQVSSASLRLNINHFLESAQSMSHMTPPPCLEQSQQNCDCKRVENGYFCVNTTQKRSKSFFGGGGGGGGGGGNSNTSTTTSAAANKRGSMTSTDEKSAVLAARIVEGKDETDEVSDNTRYINQIDTDIEDLYDTFRVKFQEKFAVLKEKYLLQCEQRKSLTNGLTIAVRSGNDLSDSGGLTDSTTPSAGASSKGVSGTEGGESLKEEKKDEQATNSNIFNTISSNGLSPLKVAIPTQPQVPLSPTALAASAATAAVVSANSLKTTPQCDEKMEEDLKKSFHKWCISCLVDDLAKHVHQVVRNDFIFKETSRYGAFKIDAEHHLRIQQNIARYMLINSTLNNNNNDGESTKDTDDGSGKVVSSRFERPTGQRPSASGANFVKPPMGDRPMKLGEMKNAQMSSRNLQVSSRNLLANNSGSGGVSPGPAGLSRGKSFSNLHRNPSLKDFKKRQSSRRLLDIGDSSGMIAEIRNVTVLFIKIDIPNMELLVDPNGLKKRSLPGTSNAGSRPGSGKDKALIRTATNNAAILARNHTMSNLRRSQGNLKFLTKTVNERISDQLLLDRMQACFECLGESFNKYGGQMRQFIVDDKGTVCIGTFGLRGSVSDDNAAAAIETASMVVSRLQDIGLTCSIGVTVGKAYCGLVGSEQRHEYAVMGPSTNLSARLMCKAPPCGILCDTEIRNRDRTHNFESLGDITAKGYKEPVGTFMPILAGSLVKVNQFECNIPMLSLLMTQKLSGEYMSRSILFLNNSLAQSSKYHHNNVQFRSSINGGNATITIVNGKADGTKQSNPVTTTTRQSMGQLSKSMKHVLSLQENYDKSVEDCASVTSFVKFMNDGEDGYHYVIQQMLKTNFYMSNDKNMNNRRDSVTVSNNKTSSNGSDKDRDSGNNSNATVKDEKVLTRLHGRRAEIEHIITFLFVPIVEQAQIAGIAKLLQHKIQLQNGTSSGSMLRASKGGKMSISEANQIPNGVFSIDEKARFVGIFGNQGLGKSSLIGSIALHIFTLSKRHTNYNIQSFKSRTNTYAQNMPFVAWKPILQEMLVRIHRTAHYSLSGANGKRKKRRSFLVGVTSGITEILSGVDYVMPLLSESLQKYRPLLGFLTIVPEDADAIAALNLTTNQEKVLCAGQLLAAIIQEYPKITHNLVFLTMENIDSFDAASMSLLQQLYTQNTGLVVIFSGRPNSNSATLFGPETDNDLFDEDGGDNCRYLDLELNQLSKAATAAIVKDVLKSTSLAETCAASASNGGNNSNSSGGGGEGVASGTAPPEVDDTTLDKIFEASKGNPMYVYELTKTIYEQQLSAHENGGIGPVHPITTLTTNIAARDLVINTNKMNSKFHVNTRIEEVICHRFDQLNTASQTVLKMAAVASSNNFPFTFELLAFIINDENFDIYKENPDLAILSGSGDHGSKDLGSDSFDMRPTPINSPPVSRQNSKMMHVPLIKQKSKVGFVLPETFVNNIHTAINGTVNTKDSIGITSGSNTTSPNSKANELISLKKANQVNNASSSGTNRRKMSLDNMSTITNVHTHNNHNDTEVNLTNALYDIIQMEDFIKVSYLNPNDRPSKTPSPVSADGKTSHNNSNNSNTTTTTAGAPSSPHRTPSKSPKMKIIQDIELAKELDYSQYNHVPKHEVTKDQIALNMYAFEFHISLEAVTIYDLLLEDQKQVIHECIAEYYQTLRNMNENNNSSSLNTVTQFVREAYHWQNAYEWSSAMYCRYYCAVLERNEYLRSMQFNIAYNLYTQMKTNNFTQALALEAGEDSENDGKGHRKPPPALDAKQRKGSVIVLSLEMMSYFELAALLHVTLKCTDRAQQREDLLTLSEGTYENDALLAPLPPASSSGVESSRTSPITVNPGHNNNRSKSACLHNNYNKDSSVQSIDRIHTIYSGDCELLHIGIRLQLKEIQKSLYDFKPCSKVQALIEDCLQQILLTKVPILLCAESEALDDENNVNGEVGMLEEKKNGVFEAKLDFYSQNDGTFEGNVEDYFYLKEFPSLFYPILSAYIQNYLMNVTANKETHDKARLICDLFLTETEREECNTATVHRIQAMSLQISVVFKTNRVPEGLALFAELRKLYSAYVYSAELIAIYGCDRMPLLFAIAAQFMLLQCDLSAANQLINASLDLVTTQRHLISIHMCIIPVCSVLVFLRRYREALSAFNNFLSVKVRVTYQADVVIDDIHRVYSEWLTRLVKYHCDYLGHGNGHSNSVGGSDSSSAHTSSSGYNNPQLFEDDASDIDLIIQHGSISHSRDGGGGGHLSTGKSVVYDYLSLFGRSVESIFVEMCAIKIALHINHGHQIKSPSSINTVTATSPNSSPASKNNDGKEFKAYCKSSLMYIKHILSLNSDYASQLLFNNSSTLITATQIYHIISKHQAKFRVTSTIQAECGLMAKVLTTKWKSDDCVLFNQFSVLVLAVFKDQITTAKPSDEAHKDLSQVVVNLRNVLGSTKVKTVEDLLKLYLPFLVDNPAFASRLAMVAMPSAISQQQQQRM